MLTLMIAAFGFMTLAPAQQPPPTQSNESQLNSADVGEEELENFVEAFNEVQVIRLDLQKKMATVQDVNAAKQLQQEANQEMVAVVQDHDMEPQQYNALSEAISDDKELMNRFQQVRKEKAKKQEE